MFNAPLSQSRALSLITMLDLSPHQQVIDLGCGNGKLLQMIAEQHAIRGIGIDKDCQLIKKAQQNNLLDLKFVCRDVLDYVDEMADHDVIICMGAEYIFGGYRELLDAVKVQLKPQGKLLIGTIYWKQPPSDDYLAIMDGQNRHFDLHETVKLAHDAGFIPLNIQRSNDDEWDNFESRSSARRYLQAIDTDDKALFQRTWDWQASYLQWGMDTMGFCFLTLQLT
jgi:cyclopropane fatty-acyl-phospholipid synthase-like methyltransferase